MADAENRYAHGKIELLNVPKFKEEIIPFINKIINTPNDMTLDEWKNGIHKLCRLWSTILLERDLIGDISPKIQEAISILDYATDNIPNFESITITTNKETIQGLPEIIQTLPFSEAKYIVKVEYENERKYVFIKEE